MQEIKIQESREDSQILEFFKYLESIFYFPNL